MQKKTYGSAKIFKGVEKDICTSFAKSAKTCEQNDLTCLGAKNKWSEVRTQEFGRLPSHCSKKEKNYIVQDTSLHYLIKG